MLNCFQFLFILSFCISLIAMENNKVIIPIFAKSSIGMANKPIFVPTENTPQANEDLLKIVNNNKKLKEKDWESIYQYLKNGADPNLKYGIFLDPLISLVIKHNKKDLFYYLLQLGADINAQSPSGWAPFHIFISHNPINFNIDDLVKNRANINAVTIGNSTSLSIALERNHFNFIKPLIQYNADINQKVVNEITPLGWSIKKEKIEVIKQLCFIGASPINADNYNNTVFHIAANKAEKIIKTLITHINFKNNNEDIRDTIKTFLLVFHRFDNDPQSNIFNIPNIPQELQIFILSKLLSVHTFHKGLYKQCKGYQQLPLVLVNDHIFRLKQILQIKNQDNETALQKLSAPYLLPYNPPQNIKMLLDGNRLEEDLKLLNETYPNIVSISPNNLALQIFENHYKQ